MRPAGSEDPAYECQLSELRVSCGVSARVHRRDRLGGLLDEYTLAS